MLRVGLIVMALGFVAACTEGCTERVNVCEKDSDCANPAFPFCDVNGEYDESGHTAMSCSIKPTNCPVERCGCEPGAVACDGETLTTCNTDGRSVSTETCSLGCSADEEACQIFDPSNGLTTQLLNSASLPDVTLPNGATIDTTDGVVKVNGVPMNIDTATVAQAGGPMIRVFLAHSWKIGDVRATGSLPLALVSVGSISVTGILDAGAHGPVAGPGNVTASHTCLGQSSPAGGGGGGNLTAGAKSSRITTTDGNGQPVTYVGLGGVAKGLAPFAGGCDGGSTSTSVGNNGRGGGAVQLVSLGDVTISGMIDIGGGGGISLSGGGGAGGSLIIEAPDVHILGKVFANGGAGAACSMNAPDASRSTDAAIGPACIRATFNVAGGSGATATILPTVGQGPGGDQAGGGGAAGRVRIATRSGTADLAGATVSAGVEMGTLNPR